MSGPICFPKYNSAYSSEGRPFELTPNRLRRMVPEFEAFVANETVGECTQFPLKKINMNVVWAMLGRSRFTNRLKKFYYWRLFLMLEVLGD